MVIKPGAFKLGTMSQYPSNLAAMPLSISNKL
jgi:hypothetical protein